MRSREERGERREERLGKTEQDGRGKREEGEEVVEGESREQDGVVVLRGMTTVGCVLSRGPSRGVRLLAPPPGSASWLAVETGA